MAIRTYKVTLDSKNTIAPEPVFLRQGDKTGAVVIDAMLMDNGSPVSLSELTPMFKANTADSKAVIADSTGFNIVNASGGEFTYQVPNALSSVPGKITTAYFSFSDTSGSESTFDVAFVIKKAVDITQSQADDYITIIDGTLNSLSDQVKSMSTDIQTLLNNYNQGNFYNKSDIDNKVSTINSAIAQAKTDSQKMADNVSNSAIIINSQASNLGLMKVAAKVMRDSSLSAWVMQAAMIDPNSGYMFAMVQGEDAGSQHIVKIDVSTGSVIANRNLGLTAVTFLEGCAMWHDAATGNAMFVIPLDALGNWCVYNFDTDSKSASFKIQGSAKYCIDSTGTYFCTIQERYDQVGRLNTQTLGINVYTFSSVKSLSPVQTKFISLKDELVRGSDKIQGFMMIDNLVYIGRGAASSAYRMSVYDTDGNLQNDYSYSRASMRSLLGLGDTAVVENEGVSVITVNGSQYPALATLINDNGQIEFAILAVGVGSSVKNSSGITPSDLSNISQTARVIDTMSLTGTPKLGVLDWALSFKEMGTYFFTAYAEVPQMATGMVSGVGSATVRQIDSNYNVISVGITFVDYNNNFWSNYYSIDTGWKGWELVSNTFINGGGSYDPLSAVSGRVITNSNINAPSGAKAPIYYEISSYTQYKVLKAISMSDYTRWFRAINGGSDSGWRSI